MTKERKAINVLDVKALKKGLIIGISALTIGSQVLSVVPVTASAADEGVSVKAGNGISVSNYADFKAAMANAAIDEINLTGDIEFPSTTNSDSDVRVTHSVTVNGNGHTINVYKNTMDGMHDGAKTVTFNNVNFVANEKDGYHSYYGVVKTSVEGYTINFNNVNYNGPQAVYNTNGTLNISGTTNLTSTDGQENMEVQNVNFKAGSKVVMTTPSANSITAYGPSNVVFETGSVVTVNGGHKSLYISGEGSVIIQNGAKAYLNGDYGVEMSSADFILESGGEAVLQHRTGKVDWHQLYAKNITISKDSIFKVTSSPVSSKAIKINGGTLNLSGAASYDIRNLNPNGNALYSDWTSTLNFTDQTVGVWLKSNTSDVPSLSWENLTATSKLSGTSSNSNQSTNSNYVANFDASKYNRIAGENIKAPDLTVNAVGDKDTVVTGTTTPGASVKAVVNGKTITGTVDANGNYRIPTGKQPAGTSIAVTANIQNKETSQTVIVKDVTAPNAPVVNPITEEDTVLTGTGEKDATVNVKLADGTEKTGTVDANGNFSIVIPAQPGDSKIEVSLTDAAGNTSGKTIVTVESTVVPNAPQVNQVTEDDVVVSGTGEAGNTVTVKLPTGQISTNVVKADGTFEVFIPKQAAGSVLEVTQTNSKSKTSDPTSVTVKDVTPPNAPTVNKVTDQDTRVTGKGEANATVHVKLPNGTVVDGKVNANGFWAVTVPKQAANAIISVTLEDAAGNVSQATTTKVVDETAPDAPKVNAINDIDTRVTGTGEKGAKVTVELADGTEKTGTVDANGNFSVVIPAQVGGSIVVVKLTDATGNVSEPTTVTVTGLPQPVINPVTIADTSITGTVDTSKYNVSKVKLIVNGADKAILPLATDGSFSYYTGNLSVGTELEVQYIGPNGTYLTDAAHVGKATVSAGDIVDSSLVLNKMTVADKNVTGTTLPNHRVRLSINGVAKTVLTADAAGNYSYLSNNLAKGTVVKAELLIGSATALTKTITVTDEDVDPSSLVVNGMTIADTTLTGKATPNVQLRINVNGAAKAVIRSDANGDFTYTTGNLPAGTEVKVEMRNAATGVYDVSKTIVVSGEAPGLNLSLDDVTSAYTSVTGSAPSGYTVRISVNGVIKGNAVANTSGQYTYNTGRLNEGDVVKAELRVGNVYALSVEKTVTQDNTPSTEFTLNPAAATDRTITGSAPANSTVRISLNGVTKALTTADATGQYSYLIGALKTGDVIKVELKNSTTGKYDKFLETTVVDETATGKISINALTDNDRTVSGKTTPLSKVRISLNGAAKAVTTSDADGNYSYLVGALKVGDVVKVELQESGVYGSSKQVTVTAGDTETKAITIEQMTELDKTLKGVTETPNSRVRIYINGVVKAITTSDATGNYSYLVGKVAVGDVLKVELLNGSAVVATKEMTVKASDGSGGSGGGGTEVGTVVLNAATAADKTVTGTAPAGAKIRLSLNGTAKAITTVNASGDFSYLMGKLNAGDVVKAEIYAGSSYVFGAEITIG
ncbi:MULTISPECIES: Ig-like domain-containing protein [Listeria]|uniref:Ig-like domain-containing protein n=1 Tax=Listeria TaxID=1637 RepID=UPI000B58B17E|nr:MULTISPECIES: Ig-like domain-containing protein [Listeria]